MPTWEEDIVLALTNLGGTGTYADIYNEIEHLRATRPPSWKKVIQRVIQDRSSDSAGFKGLDDLFFAVEGLGRGAWGLRKLVDNTPAASDLELVPGDANPRRTSLKTYRVLRDTLLARQVKLLHRDNCQLCGVALRMSSTQTYSEAHHIVPLGRAHAGPDTGSNIIVLCPNHHALCDYGAIPLRRDAIREVPGHRIDDAALLYHNEHIFREGSDAS